MQMPANTPDEGFGQDAFISYSRKNINFASNLEKALENYQPPKDLNAPQRNLNVFRDETDFTGVEYATAVQNRLRDSRKLIVVCSPDARRSSFVNGEIRVFVQERGADNIIPLIVAGIPNNEAKSIDDENRAFPDELCQALNIPLAVDYREFDLKKSKVDRGIFFGPWCKLLAEIYGVERSEIEQREKKRQVRRRKVLATIVASVILVLSAALVSTLLSRSEAIAQRKIAIARERSTRQLLYVSNMRLAEKAYLDRNYARVNEILNAHLPAVSSPLEDDVRTFDWYYFWHLDHQESETLRGHTDTVTKVAFSPDTQMVAAASLNGQIKVWDLGTRQVLGTMETKVGAIFSLTFSPDGLMLAVGGGWGDLELWQVTTHRLLGRFGGGTGFAFLVAFSPDGKTLVCGSGGRLWLWNVAAQQTPAGIPISDEFGGSSAIAVTPDLKLAANGGAFGGIEVWNVSTRRKVAQLGSEGSFSSVSDLSFSPDGKILASINSEPGVKLWSVETNRELTTLEGKTSYTGVKFSPDGKLLAAVTSNGSVELWDVATRQELVELKGHANNVRCVTFSSDGKVLATGSADQTVKLWDATTRADPIVFREDPSDANGFGPMRFSPRENKLAVGDWRGIITMWDLHTGQRTIIDKEQGSSELRGSIEALDFSPDGKLIVAGINNGMVKVLDSSMNHELAAVKSHASRIRAVAFSPDGRTVALVDDNDEVDLWDALSRSQLLVLMAAKDRDNGVVQIAFSVDGKTLAVGLYDGTIKLFEVSSRQELHSLKTHTGAGFAMAFSPDGKIFAAGTSGGQVELWDTGTLEELAILKEHHGLITFMSFSGDGKTLATSGRDWTAKLWDLSTFQELATLKGHQSIVSSVSFSPDGLIMATSGQDATVRLWIAATPQQVDAQK
jgi:WD40 repeat protein